MEERKCEVCGDLVPCKGVRLYINYCSVECYKKIWYRKNRPIIPVEKNCLFCNKKFVVSRFAPRHKCCSKKCNSNLYVRNNKVRLFEYRQMYWKLSKIWYKEKYENRVMNPLENLKRGLRNKERLKCIIHNFTLDEWSFKLNMSKGFCKGFNREPHFVGIENITLDHIYPVFRAYRDYLRTGIKKVYKIDDIQPLSFSCNSSKKDTIIKQENQLEVCV